MAENTNLGNLEQVKVLRDGQEMPSTDQSLRRLKRQMEAVKKILGNENGKDFVGKINDKLGKLEMSAKLWQEGEKLFLDVGQGVDLERISSEFEKMESDKSASQFINFADGKEGFEQGKEFSVDFQGNIGNEEKIGLSDILPKEVRKVEVQGTKNGKQYNVIGTRQGIKGGFFGPDGDYVPVFSGFKVKVLEYNENYQKDYEKNMQVNIDTYLGMEEIKKFVNKEGPEKIQQRTQMAEKILMRAFDYNIDPYLFFQFFEQNGEKGFGVVGVNADGFDEQLNLGLRTVQNAMNRYSRLSGKDVTSDREMSPDFLMFYADMYSPLGNKSDKNNKFNLIKSYSKFHGRDFSESDYENYQKSNSSVYDKIMSGSEFKGPADFKEMLELGKKYIGVRYSWGGDSTTGIDCSHFVCKMMKSADVVPQNFYLTADGLCNWGKCREQVNVGNAKEGDFMFWGGNGKKTHVALVLDAPKNGKVNIIDASGNSGAGRVDVRTVDFDPSKHIIKRPDIYKS